MTQGSRSTAVRSISYSEISTAMSCLAKWDFSYGGRLAGSCLSPRQTMPILSAGRAWGAAVAAFHAYLDEAQLSLSEPELTSREAAAALALRSSLLSDADEMVAAGGWFDPAAMLDMEDELLAVLDNYARFGPLLNLTRLEGELDVPIPARSGSGRASSRYRFGGYLDGFTIDGQGREWLVEFKLRGRLTPLWLIQIQPQVRWYAWARTQETKRPVAGVIVDEALNRAPKAPRVLQPRRSGGTPTPSHAKDQETTPELYRALCEGLGEEPHQDVIEALSARQWMQRQAIQFRAGELEEAGRELVSAARLIRDLDSGLLIPIRNASQMTCGGCRYRDICANPRDDLFVETRFRRTEPKRLRKREEVTHEVS